MMNGTFKNVKFFRFCIDGEFIGCTFSYSELCCSGSEYRNCKFENNNTMYLRGLKTDFNLTKLFIYDILFIRFIKPGKEF